MRTKKISQISQSECVNFFFFYQSTGAESFTPKVSLETLYEFSDTQRVGFHAGCHPLYSDEKCQHPPLLFCLWEIHYRM